MSVLPLVDRFPGLAGVPRIELCTLPTPLESGAALLSAKDAEGPATLRVKRDDVTSRLYGGNKTRKLEFLLGACLEGDGRAVITFGAYGSNHALATAVHACELGLEPHVILSPQAPGPFAARTLRAHAALGTHLHVVESWNGARMAVEVRRQLEERDGVGPCIIPMGGTNALGALGYVNAAFEVLAQVAAEGAPAPDAVYVAGGTLGTSIGLAVGFAVAGTQTRVVAVRVTPDEVATSEVAVALAEDTIAFMRSFDESVPALAFADLHFELRNDWFEPGYGVVTPETTDAVTLAAGDDLALETTYTGKAFAALLEDAGAGKLAGQHVIFWNTYNSAPMPPAGDDALLPEQLRAYVEDCDLLFGRKD